MTVSLQTQPFRCRHSRSEYIAVLSTAKGSSTLPRSRQQGKEENAVVPSQLQSACNCPPKQLERTENDQATTNTGMKVSRDFS